MTADDRKLPIEVNVVFIGETGSGKSTLINYFTNLFHNGLLTNLKIAIPTRHLHSNMSAIMPEHHENAVYDVTRPQTNHCTKYQFRVQQVYFNFYDTPGISDIGGSSSDDHSLARIFQCIGSVQQLAALVLAVNGTQARVTTNTKNVLEQLHERMPDVFYTNLMVIFTNCASHTVNFDSMKLPKRLPVFYMQNSAFCSDPSTWSPEIREILQRDWQRSMETMNEFITRLLLLAPISTQSLADANNDRNRIRSLLHEIRLMLMELEHIEDELAAGVSSATTEKHQTANGTGTKIIQVNEITITPYYNTLCLQCNIVCHEQCSLTESTHTGEHVFRRCAVMDNGRCTRCPGRCSYDMHYHDHRLIKSVTRTLRYATASLPSKHNEVQCRSVQEAKHLLEQRLQEACRCLQTSCSGLDVAEELYTFTELLRRDMTTMRSTGVIHQMVEVIAQLESLAGGRSTTVDKSSSSKGNKRMHKKKKVFTDVSSAVEQPSACARNQNYTDYTTEQLIDLARQSIENHMLITGELHRRCEGTSTGYLSRTDLSTICEYYSSIRPMRSDQLLTLHSPLQSEIQQLADADPAKILSVPIDKLLRLTAINLRLQHCAL